VCVFEPISIFFTLNIIINNLMSVSSYVPSVAAGGLLCRMHALPESRYLSSTISKEYSLGKEKALDKLRIEKNRKIFLKL
jgi:hypothetical protein